MLYIVAKNTSGKKNIGNVHKEQSGDNNHGAGQIASPKLDSLFATLLFSPALNRWYVCIFAGFYGFAMPGEGISACQLATSFP